MHPILTALLDLIRLKFRSRASLELEVLALRHQITVFKRRRVETKHYPFSPADRFLWSWLYRLWPSSARWMQLAKPSTVVEWHRRGFLFYWRVKSNKPGQPWKIKGQLRDLIFQMYRENTGWGIRRIQGELLKLGYDVSPQAIWKHLRRFCHPPPSPTWRVFLQNHMHETAATDMFVVFTASYRFLYALLVLGHQRRNIIHFAVSEKPTDEWLAQEVTKAFEKRRKPRYIIHDRDPLFGRKFKTRLRAMKIKEHVSGKQAPWQNIYVERVIGSIRRECLNHVIVLSRDHLVRVLTSYVRYYNRYRTHQSLNQDCPEPRPIQQRHEGRLVVSIPQVGGLHHRYERRRN